MTNCLITKPEHRATILYQHFDEFNQVWTGNVDATEMFHDRRLSHTCTVSDLIYSTAKSNKVRFIFKYSEPTMIDKFILSGITALSGLTFSVYADSNEVPTTPLIENFAQTPHNKKSRTENQVINIAGAVTAINYLLLIENDDVDDDPELRNFIQNSDLSQGQIHWNVDNQGSSNVVDFTNDQLLMEVDNDANSISVRNEFRDIIQAGGISAEVSVDIASVNTTPNNDTTEIFSIAVFQETFGPSGQFTNELVRLAFPRGDFGEGTPNRLSTVFTLPETPSGVFDTFYYVEIFASSESGEFILDNIEVRRDSGGQATHLNQPFDIRMLMAGSSAYQPSENFQGRASFSNSIAYSNANSESTKTKRRINSNRVDRVQFIRKSDNDSQDLEDLLRYELPFDGLIFWQRDASLFNFDQCFIAYIALSDRTNDYENLNSISANIEEVVQWV